MKRCKVQKQSSGSFVTVHFTPPMPSVDTHATIVGDGLSINPGRPSVGDDVINDDGVSSRYYFLHLYVVPPLTA